MRKLIVSILYFILFLPSMCLAQMPHVPGTELQWGMTYNHTQLPGTHMGNVVIQQQAWAGMPETHQVIGQYYFSPQNQLEYVQYNPNYRYESAQQWQVEYNHIEQYVSDIYGAPQQKDENLILWVTPHTQGRLIMAPKGWITRFDQIEE